MEMNCSTYSQLVSLILDLMIGKWQGSCPTFGPTLSSMGRSSNYNIPVTNSLEFRDPSAPEAPVANVPAWPKWEDNDKHYLKLDLVPTLRTDYLVTWENPEAGNEA